MDTTQNKYVSVSYQLFSIAPDGTRHIEEQTEQGNPFTFITGFGFTLDAFEQHIKSLIPGDKFDFTLQPSEAFGDYEEANVKKVSRDFFAINGHFDHEHIFPGADITLKYDDGRYQRAFIKDVDEEGVTVDTNHPLAGVSLQFIGLMLENREATKKEIENQLNMMSHDCCGCDDCEDGCCDDHHHEGGCGCGHCHH